MELTKEEVERYSRHLIIPDFGMNGQKKLKTARVLIIGAGGLGSPLALYLSAAGVGRIGIVDFDLVEHSNLHRQIIHHTDDVGKSKLKSARQSINGVNPNIKVDTYETRLTSANAFEICKDYDIIIDGTDNFPTRYLVNDVCVLLNKTNIHGSIFQFYGQASVFNAKKGPCYRCLYPAPPPPGMAPSCAEGGVLGILPGIIGIIQATETIKTIINKGNSLIGRLLTFNALEMKFREIKLKKDPDCPICGESPTIKNLIDYEQFCGINNIQETESNGPEEEILVHDLKLNLDKKEPLFILDVREPFEHEICHIKGATLIPLGTLQSRLDELNINDKIVVYCRSGIRGGKALKLLKDANFKKVTNLKGGILAWADEIDTSMPKC